MSVYFPLGLLFLGVLFLRISGEVYNVQTTNERCNGIQNCHTLEEYAINKTSYFENDDDIVLLFYEGHHVSQVPVEFLNVTKLSIRRALGESRCAVSIDCDFILKGIETVLVQGVCVHGQVLVKARDVTIAQCSIEYGPVNVSEFQTATFDAVNIYGNVGSQEASQLSLMCGACCMVEIRHSFLSDVSTTVTTHAEHCNAASKNAVTFLSSLFTGNTPFNSILVNITAVDANVNILNGSIVKGSYGGLQCHMARSDLNITDSFIQENDEMSGIFIILNAPDNSIAIKNTLVTENQLQDVSSGNPYRWYLPNGAGLSVNPGPNHATTQQSYSLLLKNVTFESNNDENAVPKTVFVYNSHSTMISDCHFLYNNGTGVAIYLTDTFVVTGRTSFIGNHAYEGGGLLLFNMHLTLNDDSHLVFYDNQVENVGGAICVRNIPIQIDDGQPCFYQLDTMSNITELSLSFANNTAQRGGNDIYGGTTRTSCTALVHSDDYTYGNPYGHIFNFSSSFGASVTSDPTRACLCNDTHTECADLESIFIKRELYPGEEFTLHLAIVGADFGHVAGSVVALVNSQSFLPELQTSQNIERSVCEELNYTVGSESGREAVMTLSIDGFTPNQWYTKVDSTRDYIEKYKKSGNIDINLLSTPLFLNMYMKPCPPGFAINFNNKNGAFCDCHSKISATGNHSCTIKNGEIFITREKRFWVSHGNTIDSNASIMFSDDCLSYQCKWAFQILNVDSPDDQCANDRSGRLCGKCKEGYSLALGSEKCLQCPNSLYLLLILLFLTLGAALVVVIKLLDLTVADGYINGLILYCNIVWINKNRLLHAVPQGFEFINVFLAWFNLDFGIQSCFFTGLTQYTYTWLQFVFPIYILLLSGILIALAQKVNILGNNGVPVLATLLLLSYYKFLVIIVSILRHALIIEIVDQNTVKELIVWEKDGSISYASGEHIPLLLMALLMLICFCIPYPLILLVSRHLNRLPNVAVVRWMLKFKPIYDAYGGPFKLKREYWVGGLLLIRAGLLIPSILIRGTAYNIILIIAMSGLFFFKLFAGRLYKTKYLALMENILIWNLIVVSSLGYLANSREHSYIACVFVTLAFVQFLILVVVKAVLLIRDKVCLGRAGSLTTDLQHYSSSYSTMEYNNRCSVSDDSAWRR